MNAPHSEAMGVLIQADLDGELDAVQAADLALHVAACDECRQLSENLRLLKAEIRSKVPRYQAPSSLREALLRQIGSKPDIAPAVQRPRWHWRWRPNLAGFGGFVAGAAVAALLLVIFLPSPPTEEVRIAGEIATATDRSLLPDHLLDIESKAPAKLSEWFRARMNFAPPVRRPAGFELAGARVDYLHHRPVAVLAYSHQGGTIELYTWPEEHAPTLPKPLTEAGFALSYWREGGIEYWAVSRSAAVLNEFVQAWDRTA